MNPLTGFMGAGSFWLRMGLVVLCGLLAVPCWGEEPEMEIYVPDVLGSPGKGIILQARIVEELLEGKTGVPDKALDFFLQGHLIGQAKTNEEGWAKLAFTPKMRGNLQVTVKGATGAQLPFIQGQGNLLSWERRRPIILVDLAVLVDGDLVPNEEAMPFPFSGLLLGEAQSAAPGELGKLAEFYYNLVYLDRTGRGTIDTILIWLRKHEFPPGMIRILPNQPTGLAELLETLKGEGWENVSAGIGETADFANVLVQNRVQAVIIKKPETTETFPRRAIVLNDWSRIRRHL